MPEQCPSTARAVRYGTCVGGPWNRKQMAHHVDTFEVFVDPDTKNPIPGAVSVHKSGEYRWTEGGDWLWQKSGS